ncbi:MAG: hypothetical protein EPN21_11625 [Methylococcaceae bacterium]|nr:MAG: hypothetical protein EPN21_11625 [Methylococcaceae bacterium]
MNRTPAASLVKSNLTAFPSLFGTSCRVLFCSLLFIMGGCMSNTAMPVNDTSAFSYAAISFTPDSQKLVFNRCQESDSCYIHILDLKTKALSYYRSPADQEWYAAKISPSGEQVVFVMAPMTSGYLPKEDKNRLYSDFGNAQIAIMDANGSNVRLLTHSKGYKMAPNFSWSGKKVIFAQGDMRKPGSKTIASHLDAYEIDLENGHIQRLTNFRFFQMGRPSYLPGDKQFVVDGDGPSKFPGIAENDISTIDILRAFEKKHRNSQFYIFNVGTEAQALEPKFDQLKGAKSSMADAQGNLYFRAQPSSADRVKLYRSDTKGSLDSWELPNMQLWFSEISPNGRLFAVISRAVYPGDLNSIHVFDLAGGKWEEISLPADANPIKP